MHSSETRYILRISSVTGASLPTVIRIYWPDTQLAGTEHYCNPVVYLFAFWLIPTAYIFLGLFTSCICCFSIVSVLLKREY